MGVGFGGGEPTLYPQLVEVCRYASHNAGLAVTMTTHGHNLTKELLDSLHGSVHLMRISMDGVGDTYRSLRGRSFEALCENVLAARLDFRIAINCLVNSTTVRELDHVAEVAARLGACELLILPEQRAAQCKGLDGEGFESLREWINTYTGPVPLTTIPAVRGVPLCNPLPFDAGLVDYAHIDATGRLRRTSFDSRGVVIGENGVLDALARLSEEDL